MHSPGDPHQCDTCIGQGRDSIHDEGIKAPADWKQKMETKPQDGLAAEPAQAACDLHRSKTKQLQGGGRVRNTDFLVQKQRAPHELLRKKR